jgi:GTPase SAR1 family protein
MIRLEILNKPIMEVCKMKCDNMLHEKLDKYEVTKYLNKHQTSLFLGSPGSGKTSLLISLFENKLLLNRVFDQIFIFQPESSRFSMDNELFSKLPNNQVFDELSLENLTNVMNRIESNSKADSNMNHCIIMDDMGSFLRDNVLKKQLRILVSNRRHLHVSIFFLCQSYKSMEPQIRKLFTNLFIFKISPIEFDIVNNELINLNKEQSKAVLNMVFDKKHEYLFVNTDNRRLFKRFDEIILSE